LSIEIAETTVAKYLGRRPSSPSPTWRTFLRTHLSQCASMDLFTVPTATFRVLFVLVILSHDRRRVVHLNVTAHPTAAWTRQQIREAFPDHTAPAYLIRDRDSIYRPDFGRLLESFGTQDVVTAPRSPWQNPFVERLIGTLRQNVSITSSCGMSGPFDASSDSSCLLSRVAPSHRLGQGCAPRGLHNHRLAAARGV
jgi:transposase InsO family protein